MKNIGIDIGASHIAGGIYDSSRNLLSNKKYVKTEFKLNKLNNANTKLIEIIIQIIDFIILTSGISFNNISSIGIACPGGIDVNKGIFFGSSTLNVSEINFKNELQKYNTNIYVENDCTCAGICESYIRNLYDFLIFTLGSDVGISYINKFQSHNEIISELKKINSKNEDNTERYIKSFADLCNKYNLISNSKCSRLDFFKQINSQDQFAKDILREFIEDFIDGIKRIRKKYNITNFCIGGGLSNYCKYYIEKIRKGIPECNIYISKYKNDSGIVGAALLEKWFKNNIL